MRFYRQGAKGAKKKLDETLPLGGMFIALYAGWFWKAGAERAELIGTVDRPWLFPVWRFLVRYLAPAAVLIVLLNQVGLFG